MLHALVSGITMIRYHSLGVLNNQHLFSTALRNSSPKIKKASFF